MPSHLMRRDGIWWFKRRVPREYARVDSRGHVKQSTRIRVADDPNCVRASQAARRFDTDLEAYWHGLANGQDLDAQRRYDEARRRARKLGFGYLPADELAKAPLEEILARLDKLREIGGLEDEGMVSALLGGETTPPILLSGLLDTYESIVRSDNRDLSTDQRRKWRMHKKRAIDNLISVIGDKPITAITVNDALDFRDWWQDRIEQKGLDNTTANKDFSRINAILKEVDRNRRLGLRPVLTGLSLAGGEVERRREPFEASFIQDRLLKNGALRELNDEARRVIFIMTETGMRPSEIVNLTADTIKLESTVPHVTVLPDGRRMKTGDSKREIPLVGVALAAAKAQPEGFPRYRDKGASLSGTINKFLSENGLRPSPAHTMYSLRHSFEDRLTAVEAPEKLIAALMGHAYSRPRYGKGPSLAQKQTWLAKIAFKPPAVV